MTVLAHITEVDAIGIIGACILMGLSAALFIYLEKRR